MNMTLYFSGMKSSLKPFIIFAVVMTIYFVIIVTMFDPELGTALKEFEKAMPEIMAMVGMTTNDTTLVGFMAGYLYGFIVPIFPMVYAIIIGNSLVAKRVDSGSMAFLLAAPVSRLQIVFTQMKVLITGIFLLIGYATFIGIIACRIYFPGELDIGAFLLLNIGAFALHLLVSGICFFASCLFNDTKYSLAVGAGIPALCYVIQMIANAGEKMEYAKYATFFTLFDPKGIIRGDSEAYWAVAVLAISGIMIYVLGSIIFVKKDIPV